VFEHAAELAEVGSGLSLWSNAVAALDPLGLPEPLRAAPCLMRPGATRCAPAPASSGSATTPPA
jgi:hypothetical protein